VLIFLKKTIDNVTMLRYNMTVTLLRIYAIFKKREVLPMDLSDKNLISKKQLLEKYEISYGALYRWKRKGLIPEDWFIKKSTTTGQETFFPKDLITERVELILEKKEDVLLDELAEKISGEEENNAKIVIETVFGEKIFFLKNIKNINLVDKNGKTRKIEILED